MNGHQLARVKWKAGLLLRPEHFTAEEESLAAEMHLHAELAGLPWRGLAALRWSYGGAGGNVLVESLTAILPLGAESNASWAQAGTLLIDVPGNTIIDQAFELKDGTTTTVTVYLVVLNDFVEDSSGASARDQPPTRALRRAVLSMDPKQRGAIASMELWRFKNDMGEWSLDESFAPPLLLVGEGQPFLATWLKRLHAMLSEVAGGLGLRVADSVSSADRSDAWRCIGALRRLDAMLLDVVRGRVRLHPYVLFSAVRDFYIELSVFRRIDPRDGMPDYTHDTPTICFQRLFELVDAAAKPLKKSVGPARFERTGDRFRLRLPSEVGGSRDVYLVIQRPDAKVPAPIDKLRLASPTRLEQVHRKALPGIPFDRMPESAVPAALGPGVDLYRLNVDADDWHHAVQERALDFYAAPTFDRLGAALYVKDA